MLETAWESRWLPDLNGGLAQLGEHLPCKQGVESSNLLVSIHHDSFMNHDKKDLAHKNCFAIVLGSEGSSPMKNADALGSESS